MLTERSVPFIVPWPLKPIIIRTRIYQASKIHRKENHKTWKPDLVVWKLLSGFRTTQCKISIVHMYREWSVRVRKQSSRTIFLGHNMWLSNENCPNYPRTCLLRMHTSRIFRYWIQPIGQAYWLEKKKKRSSNTLKRVEERRKHIRIAGPTTKMKNLTEESSEIIKALLNQNSIL